MDWVNIRPSGSIGLGEVPSADFLRFISELYDDYR
jgi:hypothetical protein